MFYDVTDDIIAILKSLVPSVEKLVFVQSRQIRRVDKLEQRIIDLEDKLK